VAVLQGGWGASWGAYWLVPDEPKALQICAGCQCAVPDDDRDGNAVHRAQTDLDLAILELDRLDVRGRLLGKTTEQQVGAVLARLEPCRLAQEQADDLRHARLEDYLARRVAHHLLSAIERLLLRRKPDELPIIRHAHLDERDAVGRGAGALIHQDKVRRSCASLEHDTRGVDHEVCGSTGVRRDDKKRAHQNGGSHAHSSSVPCPELIPEVIFELVTHLDAP